MQKKHVKKKIKKEQAEKKQARVTRKAKARKVIERKVGDKKQDKQHKNKQYQSKKRVKKHKALITIAIIAVLGLTISVYLFSSKDKGLDITPAKIKALLIQAPCDCYDFSNFLDQLSKLNVELTVETLNYSSPKARSLIKEFHFKKLPALVVKGQVLKHPQVVEFLNSTEHVFKNKAYGIQALDAPWYDLDLKTVKGMVNVVLITPDCEECTDLSSLTPNMITNNVLITNYTVLNANSSEALKLILKYNITRLPCLLLSKDALLYNELRSFWQRIGTVEQDMMVARLVNPPFIEVTACKNLAGNLNNVAMFEINNSCLAFKKRGLVSVIYITDSSCKECYNVTMHKTILQRFGVFIANETLVDVNSVEGKKLVEKYNITLVPTIVLSPEALLYQKLVDEWQNVGFKASDDWLVFKNVYTVRGYVFKNLSDNHEYVSTKQGELILVK